MNNSKMVLLCLLMVCMMCVVFIPATAVAATEIKVVVDGKQLVFPDAPAFIDSNNRTQVPVRFVMEELGCKVGWDSATQYVTITRGETTVQFIINQSIYKVNGVTMPAMDTQAVIRDSRTYVPIRFATEAFGASVRWDGATRTVYVDSTGKQAEDPVENPAGNTGGYSAAMFDEYGLLKLEYAEPLYQKLLDSMKIVYEGGIPYFCYTVPENVPDNATLGFSMKCTLKDSAPTGVLGWIYRTTELDTGHRASGKYEYLLPISGTVKKPLTPIELKHLDSILISIGLFAPPGAISAEQKRASQSSWNITIIPDKLRESYIYKAGQNANNVDFPGYPKTVTFNATNMIQK
jgi:hypothetical protein